MLKRIVWLVLLLPGLLLAAPPVRVVFHINEAEKLSVLVNNATNLKKDMGKDVIIEVVVNGTAVTRLASSSNTGDSLKLMLDAGIELGACSNAMRNTKLDASMLYPGVKIVEEGGITRIVHRQQQGYLYIKI